ncbi:MAG: glycoside hydrolase family 36 protein [Bacillota bacterium]
MDARLEACLVYRTEDGRRFEAYFAPAEGWEDGCLTVQPSLAPTKEGFSSVLCLSAHRPLTLIGFEVRGCLPAWADEETRTLINGFQSWSRTEEPLPHARQRTLSPLAWFLRPYGEPVRERVQGSGRFHSWWFTHLRRPGHALLLGSTDERSGFTLFGVEWPGRTWWARKDCGGRHLEEGEDYRLCGLFIAEGPDLAALYDEFARASGIMPPDSRPRTAWLSWYYYYTRVTAAEIRRVLAGLKELGVPLDFFLIDDGYEPAVGDWLAPSARFPQGPAPLAEEIRAAGYIPGIWVAPFVAERRSALWRDHPDWFLRGPDGRPLPAGMNPNWSGVFFALDLSRPEPREYVREVIRTMTAWGFRLIKLDFAYAACLRPTPRRTRGELMAEAIELVRAAAGDSILLGCGVPLGAAPGVFDYCRIGPDVAPYWEDRKLHALGYPERVATENALTTILNRSFLAGRLLPADPDACLLRDRATHLTPHQRRSLFLLTYLCGSLFSFSDPPELLGQEEGALLRRIFPPVVPRLLDHRRHGVLHELHLDHLGDRFLVLANLSGRPATWPIPEECREALLFDQLTAEILLGDVFPSLLRLAPYETRLFKVSLPGPTQVVGTSLHLLGGKADVSELKVGPDGEISLALVPGLRAEGGIWLALAEDAPSRPSYGGRTLPIKEWGRFKGVKIWPKPRGALT